MSGIIGSAGSKSGVIGVTELDYEEGEWTMVPNFTLGTFEGAHSKYYRVGNLVSIRGYFYDPSANNGDMIQMTGIPFTPATDCIGSCKTNNVNVEGTSGSGETFDMTAEVSTGAGGSVQLYESRDGMSWHRTRWDSFGASGGHCTFFITYMI